MKKYIFVVLLLFIIGLAIYITLKTYGFKGDMDKSNNQFFFQDFSSNNEYNGIVEIDGDLIKGIFNCEINDLGEYRNGKVYKLIFTAETVKSIEDFNLGYFYVEGDKIYKINSTSVSKEMLKNNKELLYDSVIVCQNKEVVDELDESEAGIHEYILLYGDTCEYKYYNNQVETGYYENIIWKRGVGLVSYRSGYGAERELIEFNLKSSEIN